jgi:S1-C subfamily serine protease
MEKYINSNPYNLSMGQRQRIAIASVLSSPKEFLLLDEVTSMIDYNGKQEIYKIIEKLKKGEKITEKERGYLGITRYETSVLGDAGLPKGVYIKSIVKNSGADKAGLSIGNIITKVDEIEIESFEDVSAALEDKKAGDKVTVYVKYASGRDYKEKKVTVKLSSYKEVN